VIKHNDEVLWKENPNVYVSIFNGILWDFPVIDSSDCELTHSWIFGKRCQTGLENMKLAHLCLRAAPMQHWNKHKNGGNKVYNVLFQKSDLQCSRCNQYQFPRFFTWEPPLNILGQFVELGRAYGKLRFFDRWWWFQKCTFTKSALRIGRNSLGKTSLSFLNLLLHWRHGRKWHLK